MFVDGGDQFYFLSFDWTLTQLYSLYHDETLCENVKHKSKQTNKQTNKQTKQKQKEENEETKNQQQCLSKLSTTSSKFNVNLKKKEKNMTTPSNF